MYGLKRVRQELASRAGSNGVPDRMPGSAGTVESEMITEAAFRK